MDVVDDGAVNDCQTAVVSYHSVQDRLCDFQYYYYYYSDEDDDEDWGSESFHFDTNGL